MLEVEKMLDALNYDYKLVVDKIYNSNTAYNVKAFQKKYKLKQTGIVNKATYDKLKSVYQARNQEQPKPDTKPTFPTNPTTPVTPGKPEQPQNPGAGMKIPLPAELTSEEKEMVQLVNQERTSRGLAPYQVDMQLVKVAHVKAQEMVTKGYFSHTSPTYGSPFQMMDTFGIRYLAAAENIAQNYSVSSAHQMFMNSSGHKANIMSPTYEYVAIAVVNGGPHGKTFVQMFLKK
ncbi:CAP domain-containing protein [Brevibacillus sp. NPDC003359]|uniref:CAP domain-containing protein n=1 Tax=unclassified Brevibacillus TaxID=2684853 RepID=UPI0036B14580